MKILFISARHPEKSKVKDGGVSLTKSNFRCLKEIGDVEVFSILPDGRSILNKILRIFFLPMFYTGGLLPWIQRSLLKKSKKTKWDVIFIDNSSYGRLTPLLKKSNPSTQIVVHFHNIEKDYALESIPAPKPLRMLISEAAAYNEKSAVKYADTLITLSALDSKKLKNYYSRSANYIIPICLDAPKDLIKDKQKTSSENYLLYCGSMFPPNIQGISWFITEVLPKLDIQLIVAGFNMELAHLPQSFKVKNMGTVDDMAHLYSNALAVINPVFLGGGMKTKTIEAMKFGKAVFATSQGWRGIERPNDLPLYLCESTDEFVHQITMHVRGTHLMTFAKISNFFEQNFSENKKAKTLSKIFSIRDV